MASAGAAQAGTKLEQRSKKRKQQGADKPDAEELAFYSPTGSARFLQPAPEPSRYVGPATNAVQPPAGRQQQQQQAAAPPRQAAAPPPQQQQRQQEVQQQSRPAAVRVEMVILPSPPRPPKRGKKVSALSPAAPRGNAGPAEAADATARAAAPLRAVAPVQQAAAAAPRAAASAGAAAAPPPPPAAAQRRRSSGSRRPERKTLTVRGKRAAVLGVLADVELQRAAAAPAVSAGAAPGAAAAQQQQRAPAQPPAAPQQQQQQQPAAQPPADPAATANLGRAWSKADVATLARLAEDRAFLLLTIPQHPPGGELDWELISRHFGRYSRGGVAVQHQYRSVVRLMKEARQQGRRGTSYVDLVQQALAALPDKRGTVYDVQAVLKRDHCSALDKYKMKGSGTTRWKAAVGEVLREQGGIFEQAGRTPTGKIIWQLKAAAEQAAGRHL